MVQPLGITNTNAKATTIVGGLIDFFYFPQCLEWWADGQAFFRDGLHPP